MSFRKQPNGSSCGTTSLRYVLALLGRGMPFAAPIENGELVELAGLTALKQAREGTDEDALRLAARRLGLDVAFHHFKRADTQADYLAALRAATNAGHPCITSWHDDATNHFHWVCVAGFDGHRVIVLDPALLDDGEVPPSQFERIVKTGGQVPGFMSIRRFEEWTLPEKRVAPGHDYQFFMELWPAEDHVHAFVPGRLTAELLQEMRADPEICEHFDAYIDDLRTIFGAPSRVPNGRDAYTLLFNDHRRVMAMVKQWAEAPLQPYFQREYDTLLAFTRAYDFRVEAGAEDQALMHLAFHLGWMGAEYNHDVGRYE